MKIKDEIQELCEKHKQYKEQNEKIEKKYKIHICSINERHSILEKIDKTIKIYIQVGELQQLQKITKELFGENWLERYGYFDDYAYTTINDIMFYYLFTKEKN